MLLDEIKSIKGTKSELRKFGVTIGIFLLVIAAWLFWKQLILITSWNVSHCEALFAEAIS